MSDQTERKLSAKEKAELKKAGRLNPEDHSQTDYVEPGSPAHAALLGIQECEPTEKHPFEYELMDPTIFGAGANEEFLTRVLKAKIQQLKSKPAQPQTKHRFEPGYAQPMWEPEE